MVEWGGEDLVVDAARAELQQLGHADLACSLCRVSLTSDQLGYDVTAPRVGGPPRLLEVKTSTAAHVHTIFPNATAARPDLHRLGMTTPPAVGNGTQTTPPAA